MPPAAGKTSKPAEKSKGGAKKQTSEAKAETKRKGTAGDTAAAAGGGSTEGRRTVPRRPLPLPILCDREAPLVDKA